PGATVCGPRASRPRPDRFSEPPPENRPPLLVDRLGVGAVARQQVRDVLGVFAKLGNELLRPILRAFFHCHDAILSERARTGRCYDPRRANGGDVKKLLFAALAGSAAFAVFAAAAP